MRIVFIALLIAACASIDMPAQPRFTRGYATADELRFEPFEPYAWSAAATADTLGFDPNHLSASDLARLFEKADDYANAEFEFRLNATAATRDACYRLLSASGAHRLTFDSVRGTARYILDSETHTAIGPTFYGFVYTVSPLTESGIVMRTTTCRPALRLLQARIAFHRAIDGRAMLELHDGERTTEADLGSPWFGGILAAYAFAVADSGYLFVQWTPDESGALTPLCASNFSLYAVEDHLREIITNNVDCDV